MGIYIGCFKKRCSIQAFRQFFHIFPTARFGILSIMVTRGMLGLATVTISRPHYPKIAIHTTLRKKDGTGSQRCYYIREVEILPIIRNQVSDRIGKRNNLSDRENECSTTIIERNKMDHCSFGANCVSRNEPAINPTPVQTTPIQPTISQL